MVFNIHLHRWTDYLYAVKDVSVWKGKYSTGHFRHCECGKWQEYVSTYGGGGWQDCEAPNDNVDLILYKDWESF